MRRSTKVIEFTQESMLAILQETYNEIVEQRTTALKIQNKMLQMLNEPADMITIGPVIEKQQKIINDCVDKKLAISKIQSTIWQKKSAPEQSFSFSDLDDDAIEKILAKDSSNDTTAKYKMKK